MLWIFTNNEEEWQNYKTYEESLKEYKESLKEYEKSLKAFKKEKRKGKLAIPLPPLLWDSQIYKISLITKRFLRWKGAYCEEIDG